MEDGTLVADPVPETRPKVAHVVISLACGGLERVVVDLARTHHSRGLESVVVCLDERGALADEVEQSGVRVLVVKRAPGWDPGLVRRLATVFGREALTCVHTHSLDPMFYGGLAARLAGVPIRVHSQHNTMLEAHGLSDRVKFRAAARVFTHVVGVSGQTTALIARSGVPAGRRATVLNGVDCERFDEARRARAEHAGDTRTADCFSIGTVARLAPEKGLGVLLEAFRSLRARRPNVRLSIVGDGPERARLEEKAASLGLGDAVLFPGRQDAVAKWLATFDLFVLPSLTEGIPLALLEAMAAGVPVVATRVGGVPEVVTDPRYGVLVAAGSPDALETAVEELIDNPSARRTIGEAGAERVREAFSLRSMAAGYRSVYTSAPPSTLFRRLVRTALQRGLPRRLAIWRGAVGRPHVAVTFDDGPVDGYTQRILDVLRQQGARATFFLLGSQAEAHPDLVKRIVEDGHEIGNHSYSHPRFEHLSLRAALTEVDRTQAALGQWAPPPTSFRPPRGQFCLASVVSAWRRGLTLVFWSIDLKDFRAADPAEVLASLARCRLASGDVVLYHGNSEAAIEALPAVLSAVRAAGLSCVPVSRL
jgi:sugar transferase (PEP-CTERM/EpsH1 system associated)